MSNMGGTNFVELQRRLDFVCIGPQRAGTTWLYECMRNHPCLLVPSSVKETYFFDRHYQRGFDWYWGHFASRHGAIYGEIAPTYLTSTEAHSRIHGHNANCRILAVLRDPVERAYSLFLHERRKGRVSGSFLEAIRSHPNILEGSRYARH